MIPIYILNHLSPAFSKTIAHEIIKSQSYDNSCKASDNCWI
jgi:hypothetical protein